MGTYESTTTVTASPDELFAYLSDVHNLPDYFAAMKSADPAGRDRPRDWVLRADTTYQIEYDADGGWLVYGLTVLD